VPQTNLSGYWPLSASNGSTLVDISGNNRSVPLNSNTGRLTGDVGGNAYRYGFNGKENDKDAGEGIQDYGMRIYDERLGRFLSVDPLAEDYPYYTPYQFAGNSPIELIDMDGAEGGKLINKLLEISDAISDFFTFESEKEEIKEGVGNISEGINKQVVGPWDWRIFNSENPGLEIEIRRIDGQIQSTLGVVQVSSGIQGISQKVQTVVEIPLILKSTSKPALKKVTTTATSEIKPAVTPQATKSSVIPDDAYTWKGPLTYDHLTEPKKVGPYLETTRAQRNRILEYNRKMNDGVIRSDIDGSVGDQPVKIPKGSKANMKQAEVDHVDERSDGGSNSNKNQRVTLKQQNHDKEMERRKNKKT